MRPRVLQCESGNLRFPSKCTVCFTLSPGQPFGTQSTGGRSLAKDDDLAFTFDANTGQHSVRSSLSPLTVSINGLGETFELTGDVLNVSKNCESPQELETLINRIYFALPVLLNSVFADPPIVERVTGLAGDSSFSWELQAWALDAKVTSQQQQEKLFEKSAERIPFICDRSQRRLFAALHYFHVACRLSRVANTPGEFVPEMLLNLCKTLESLFPPDGNGLTRDAVRRGLKGLGYSEQEINCKFIPAMALRNEIDVGHVELGLFSMDQLTTIHSFTGDAEAEFRRMFKRLFECIDSGTVKIKPYEASGPRKSAVKIVERMKQCGSDQNA